MLEELKELFWFSFEMGKRRGSLDPRIGLALAATFITAFISIMIISIVEPEVSANFNTNSTLYTSYQDFLGYTGKSFKMWGLAIFVSVLGLILGAIWSFWGGK